MRRTGTATKDTGTAWLVRLEILAVILIDLTLVFLCFSVLAGFLAVAAEIFGAPGDPGSPALVEGTSATMPIAYYEKMMHSPAGYIFTIAITWIPIIFLAGLAILIHRFVVVPLAEREDAG